MTDITAVYRAYVKTIRTRNKALGVQTDNGKSSILPSTSRKTEFGIRAKEVLGNISRLHSFLQEHKRSYLDNIGHFSGMEQMSDSERDQIDAGAQKIMKTCHQLIQELKQTALGLPGNPQSMEHRMEVLEILKLYLKGVCQVYSEQRAIRVKRSMEMHKMSRLETNVTGNLKREDSNKTALNDEAVPSTFFEEDELSPEEIQILERENSQLYNQLNSLGDEVRHIESKVVKIAELQQIFTDKVLQQEKDIEKISTTVIGSTENVRMANEQLRQAIRQNAGFRIMIIFCLIVMAFSLLFLDWFND